jgi:hypothetical protein
VLLADEGGGEKPRRSWRGYFTGLASRSRVVQVSVVAIVLALFILMKRLSSEG